VLLQQFGNDLVLLNEQPLNEVSSEDGDLLLAGINDTFPMIGHWRQPFCNRQTPAHFPARETKVSKTDHTTAHVMLHPVSQHQTLMARSSVEQATLVASLSSHTH
jgi:hypothetical protein